MGLPAEFVRAEGRMVERTPALLCFILSGQRISSVSIGADQPAELQHRGFLDQ